MKMLKKLALVSAISMISAGAFAMEAMDDESMAAATGQDGITILVKPGVISNSLAASMGVTQATRDLVDNPSTGYFANNDNTFAGLSIGSIVVHDDDGLGPIGTEGTGNSGALVIGGGYDKNANGATNGAGDIADGDVSALADRTVLLADGSKAIKIDVDMVGNVTAAVVAAASAASTAASTAVTAASTASTAASTALTNLNAARDAAAVTVTGNALATYASLTSAQKVTADALPAVVTTLIASANADAASVAAADNVTITAAASAKASALAATNPGAMLNVTISTPRLAIKTGNIYVANSNAAEVGRDADGVSGGTGVEVDGTGTTAGSKIKILSGLEIVMGEATTTIQLGSEAQGHMIVANTSLIGGLTINNLELFDAGGILNPTLGAVVTTGGSLYAKSLSFKDAGGSNLTVKANVDIGSANATDFSAAQAANIRGNIYVAAGVGTAAAYAAILDAADGADNTLGTADDDTGVPMATLTATNAALATTYNTLQSGTKAAYNGLVIETAQLGDAVNGADLAINSIRIGDSTAATLGDVQILGLNINGTVMVISGH